MLVTIAGDPKEMAPLLAFLAGGKGKAGKSTTTDEPGEDDLGLGLEEQPEEPGEEDLDVETLVKLCQTKVKKNPANKAKIGAILATFKVKSLTDLKPVKYEAFKAQVDKLK